MRNLFLILLLANSLLFAWQQWINPATAPPMRPGADQTASLVLYGSQAPTSTVRGPTVRTADALLVGPCVRIGPFQEAGAAEQAARVLAARQIAVSTFAREGQVWLGHGVQVGGFVTVEAAEEARRKLAAGGLADAYLLQEGATPMVSLGVFREQARADRVTTAARQLGFEAATTDRYRPAVEQWLLVRPAAGQSVSLEDLKLGEARILRTDSVPCEDGPASGEQPTGETP